MLGGVTHAEPFLQKEVGLIEDLLAIPVKIHLACSDFIPRRSLNYVAFCFRAYRRTNDCCNRIRPGWSLAD